MAIRCEFNLNGGKRRLVMARGPEETWEHVALRLASCALFWPLEPKVEISPKHPALGGIEFRPDFVALNAAGEVGMWGECGNVSLNKLDKLTRRFPGARIVVLKASEREARRMRSDLEDGVERQGRIEIRGFQEADFSVWRQAVDEKVELFGEASEHSFNLVINNTPLACDVISY